MEFGAAQFVPIHSTILLLIRVVSAHPRKTWAAVSLNPTSAACLFILVQGNLLTNIIFGWQTIPQQSPHRDPLLHRCPTFPNEVQACSKRLAHSKSVVILIISQVCFINKEGSTLAISPLPSITSTFRKSDGGKEIQ